jgi:ketosteroid isomerase-like protein
MLLASGRTGNLMKKLILSLTLPALALLLLLWPWRLDSGQPLLPEDSPTAAITSVLLEQQAAWNRADLDAFMQGYWNSPELSFAGTSGITRGWQPVLARYRKNYPDPQAMGHLDFSALEVHPLGIDAAFVLGRWHLQRSSDELGGIFTLVFQRFPEGWCIVHDHTSVDAKTP